MFEITSEEITAWLNEPVTRHFMSLVQFMKDDHDKRVHQCLENPKTLSDAQFYNAGIVIAQDVLDLPQKIINDLKEEEKDENS